MKAIINLGNQKRTAAGNAVVIANGLARVATLLNEIFPSNDGIGTNYFGLYSGCLRVDETNVTLTNPKLGVEENDFTLTNPKLGDAENDFTLTNPKLGDVENDFTLTSPKQRVDENDFTLTNSKVTGVETNLLTIIYT